MTTNKKTWVLVEQNNWREEVAPGRFQLSDRRPPDLEAAHGWPGTTVVEAEKPPSRWGRATYSVEDDGLLVRVGADWDRSN